VVRGELTLEKLRAAAAAAPRAPSNQTGTQTVFAKGSTPPAPCSWASSPATPRTRLADLRRSGRQAARPRAGGSGHRPQADLRDQRGEALQVDAEGKAAPARKAQMRGRSLACKPWLLAELAVIQPEVLVCLGSTAAQAILAGPSGHADARHDPRAPAGAQGDGPPCIRRASCAPRMTRAATRDEALRPRPAPDRAAASALGHLARPAALEGGSGSGNLGTSSAARGRWSEPLCRARAGLAVRGRRGTPVCWSRGNCHSSAVRVLEVALFKTCTRSAPRQSVPNQMESSNSLCRRSE